ncbi:MAG: biotin/lipoyl-binding protein [Chloroflexi bacterium]|nr:biotin/lipoyl-binding protein [Chloroflexota bacterium]
MSTRSYKITIAGQTYDVQVGDISSSPVEVVVDGTTYQVELPDVPAIGASSAAPAAAAQATQAPAPRPLTRPAVPTAAGDGVVRSPMPGRIINVSVAVGDTVTRGQPVIVLESMKMENTITSPVDGTVSAVHVAAGDSVQHGQTLVEIAQA